VLINNLFEVRDAQWSSKSSFSLPAWHGAIDWKTGYRNLWLSEDPDSEHNQREKYIDSWRSLQELSENAKIISANRLLIYIPVNIQGNEQALWSEVLEAFNYPTPSWNVKIDPVGLTNGGVPHLALCIDKKKSEIENETTFLVPHWESLGFIELFLYSCKKVFGARPPQILVIDDGSSDATFNELLSLCQNYGANVRQIERIDKGKVADVGAVLDFGMNFVGTKYVCMLDADIVLINSGIIKSCVKLLEDNSIVSVGLDTSLAEEYHSNFKWGKTKINKSYGKQLPGYFSVTNNLFRFMRTEDAKSVSVKCGFARAAYKRKTRDQIGRILRRFARKYLNSKQNLLINDFLNSRFLNSRYPIMPPTCDNGVAANAWMDQNMMGVKWNYPISSYGVMTASDGVAFQNISGLLVHIALSTRALSESRREVENAGEAYYTAIRNILERSGTIEQRFESTVELSLSIRN
jgi:glycosyltransferase involved in cell wall biosynthesis